MWPLHLVVPTDFLDASVNTQRNTSRFVKMVTSDSKSFAAFTAKKKK